MTLPTDIQLARLPKVSLHDHLDGGLRPATVLELAREIGWPLPREDADALGAWFFEAADSGSLVRYLETFDQTLAVMQTATNLRRIAREYVEDLVADGVVYAETRWAPEQHQRGGLTLTEAVEAVAAGLEEGMDAARAAVRPIVVRQLLTTLRHTEPHLGLAKVAVALRDRGVVGYDLAGPEIGFPASRFAEMFAFLRTEGMPLTIHAGEAVGVESIRDALACGALRLGHGVRIIEDVQLADGTPMLGEVATLVRDRRIPLEVCPTSNVQTGVCASIAEHPMGRLVELGFTVTLNCDNRLMSDTTLTSEWRKVSEAFGFTLDDIERMTIDAARATFQSDAERERLVDEVIRPGFASLVP